VDDAATPPGRSSPSQVITVVTVDGDPLARRALHAQLSTERDLELVGEAPDASTGVEVVRSRQPDLALIAVTPDDQHSTDAISKMLTVSPHTRTLVLALEGSEDAQMRLLRAGAVGWLLKSIDPDVLPRVLRCVHSGEAAVPRALGMRVVKEALGSPSIDRKRLRPIRSPLTRREWEVIDLLVEGASTASIANELQLSSATVRTHVKHILGKLGVHSRNEAIRHVEWLRREGEGSPPGRGERRTRGNLG